MSQPSGQNSSIIPVDVQPPQDGPVEGAVTVELQDTVSYTDRTERLKAIAQLLKSVAPFIWGLIILIVVMPFVGRSILLNLSSTGGTSASSSEGAIAVVSRPDWRAIDQSMAVAFAQAHDSAKDYATNALETWKAEQLIPRLDNFLDWYFGYFNQKKFELTVPYLWAKNQVMKPFASADQAKSVSDQITQQFEHEFAKRVLVPSLAQITLERITQDTTEHYIAQVQSNIQTVQHSYQLPQGDWERYLDGLSLTVMDTEGNTISNSLKSLVIGGGGYLFTKPILALSLAKVSSKFGAKAVGSATTKVAAKTGGAVAAELGASVLDPLVGIALLAWDAWDYGHTVAMDRPVLRDNLLRYLDEMNHQLLHHPEASVMASVDQLEMKLYQSLQIESARHD